MPEGHFPGTMFFPVPPPLFFFCLATADGPDLDDAALAEKIRAGDHRAFKALFDRHHRTLYAYLCRRGIAPEAAEDLVQQAFVTIWERRHEIDPSRSIRAFLFRIGYTRALNHIRDNAKFVNLDDSFPQGEVAHQADPDGAALRKSFRKAVAQLPERRRAVFELCFIQQLTYREAAEALGISIKTVEHQMGHALKALREALEEFRHV